MMAYGQAIVNEEYTNVIIFQPISAGYFLKQLPKDVALQRTNKRHRFKRDTTLKQQNRIGFWII